jgi:hypothetical protein
VTRVQTFLVAVVAWLGIGVFEGVTGLGLWLGVVPSLIVGVVGTVLIVMAVRRFVRAGGVTMLMSVGQTEQLSIRQGWPALAVAGLGIAIEIAAFTLMRGSHKDAALNLVPVGLVCFLAGLVINVVLRIRRADQR